MWIGCVLVALGANFICGIIKRGEKNFFPLSEQFCNCPFNSLQMLSPFNHRLFSYSWKRQQRRQANISIKCLLLLPANESCFQRCLRAPVYVTITINDSAHTHTPTYSHQSRHFHLNRSRWTSVKRPTNGTENEKRKQIAPRSTTTSSDYDPQSLCAVQSVVV